MSHRDYLFSLEIHGIKLGLDNIRFLMDAAGHPEHHLPTVHVAGTNGKGSVGAMLDAMLGAAGYSVGRFTKPHLLDVTERFLLGRRPISAAELDEEIAFFRQAAEGMGHPPTFFEVNTAIVLRWLAARRVDAAVIEVGMGGRFDSTNVASPLLSIITNIDLDHTRYLGDSLDKIAFEKAGILKEGVPLVLGETRQGPEGVILNRANELGCPVVQLERDFSYEVRGDSFDLRFDYTGPRFTFNSVPLGLRGCFQGTNAAVATAAAEQLSERYPRLDEKAVVAGLRDARCPCRLERVLESPPVIIDVAHNPAGAQRLAEALNAYVLVLAVSSDKDAEGIIDALAPKAQTMILSQFTGRRALPAGDLSAKAGSHSHRCVARFSEAIDMGLGEAKRETPLVIAGGFFTAGEARRYLMDAYAAPPPAF